MSSIEKDPWAPLKRHTAARIALGRAGGSLPSEAVLEFRLAHARARDAVQRELDALSLVTALENMGVPALPIATLARERATFLLRPDQGRSLDPSSAARLVEMRERAGVRDLVIIVSDGLSALAAERQAAPLLRALAPRLADFSLYPVLVAPFARVKLGDEVGELLGARQSLILLGERPGLTAPDSLGAYLTYRPDRARTDADRNCVSNIRPEGLPIERAADTIAALLKASAERQLSGVALKEADVSPALLAPGESR
jgi:ethanolamine ammonia-lyase small subunit